MPCQHVPKGTCPYFVICGWPRTINEQSEIGQIVAQAGIESCNALQKEGRDVLLLNTAVDNPNHNAKNSWYQMIGGSWAIVMGFYVLGLWLLNMPGVSQELWRVKDYASGLLILRLSSAKTITLLNQLDNVCLGSRAVLNTTLYFTRLHLFGVNAKKLGFRERAMYSRATMIWFTSFKKPIGADNGLANKQNMVAETLDIIFLVTRSDAPNPRHAASEPCEHTFGCLRVMI
eukprot:5787452-Ditylum_brightwellii.AAC.1